MARNEQPVRYVGNQCLVIRRITWFRFCSKKAHQREKEEEHSERTTSGYKPTRVITQSNVIFRKDEVVYNQIISFPKMAAPASKRPCIHISNVFRTTIPSIQSFNITSVLMHFSKIGCIIISFISLLGHVPVFVVLQTHHSSMLR